MKYSQVKNCRYSNSQQTAITCDVLFDIYGWLPFTASLGDLAHSEEIFTRAVQGEFGLVEPYVPIDMKFNEISKETLIRNKRNNLLQNLDSYVNNPLRWNNYNQEQQNDFARYRQELLDITQQSGFPDDVVWPTAPANLQEPSISEIRVVE